MEGRDEPPVDPVAVRRITPFVRPPLEPEQVAPDYFALLSLCFGVLGLMAKVCPVLMSLVAHATHRHSNAVDTVRGASRGGGGVNP